MGGYSSLVPRTHPFQYARFYFSCCDIVLYSLFFLISLLLWSIWSMINHFLSQQPRKEEKKKRKKPLNLGPAEKNINLGLILLLRSAKARMISLPRTQRIFTRIASSSLIFPIFVQGKQLTVLFFCFFFLLIIGHWFIWIFIFFSFFLYRTSFT